MSAKKTASGRGWDILAAFVKERASYTGEDADLAGDDKAEELQAGADLARRLLRDRSFMQVRLNRMEQIVEDFVLWLDLDPTRPTFHQELVGIHMRAAPRFLELFWPEEEIRKEKEHRAKAKEADGGQRIRKGR